jgi:UDP-N-acetylmuramoyl-tripeptide--D-alanyl-D-alanine ligase
VDIKISELVKETGGKALGALHEDPPVGRVSTDTRLVEKDDVFFAFVGKRFDGHAFLAEAFEKGARHFVVSDAKRVPVELSKKANVILVDDTVRAYGDLARAHRQKFKVPAVAVTGSSGKTTVKEMTAHLLSSKYKVLKNRGTENNLIGVPKTLFLLDASHGAVVLELGTNCPGEIERLSSIVSPQVGILTQIGASHLEGLKNIEGVRQEKLSLLKKVERGGWIFLNGEDPWLRDVQSGVHKIRRVGLSKEGMDLWAEEVWAHEQGTSFTVTGGHRFETQLIGRHNLVNCLLALQCALTLGVDIASLQRALKEFKPVTGRLC